MRAHVINDGVIANTIEVDSLDVIPGLVDASIGGSIGDSIVNGAVVPKPAPPAPVPESVSPRQIREALMDAGLFDAVDGAVAASGDRKLQNWWEFATEFQRMNPHVLAMAQALGVTDAQLDGIWILAGSL